MQLNKTNTLIQELREKAKEWDFWEVVGDGEYAEDRYTPLVDMEWYPKLEQFLIKAIDQTTKEVREEVRHEIYQLDWIKILSEAIEGRPTSFHLGRFAINEWRNASDQILGTLMTHAEDKGIFKSLKQKVEELSQENKQD